MIGQSLLTLLFEEPNTDDPTTLTLNDTAITQPALFALEYALAELWRSWGVHPDILLGHSVGELVAACLAGVYSLEDGLQLIAARGRLMQALPSGDMLSIRAAEAQVADLIAPYTEQVSIAAINGPASIVVSGESAAVQQIAKDCATAGLKTRALTVSHAFHSPMMEPMLAAFRQVAERIAYQPPKIPWVSNLTGQLADDTLCTACLLYTSPSPRDLSTSRMPSSA